MPIDRDDFPTLHSITTRPVALNLVAWDIDCLPDPLDSEHVAMEIVRHLFPPPWPEEIAMSEPLEYRTEHHTQCLFCSGSLVEASDDCQGGLWYCRLCRVFFASNRLASYEPGEWKRQEEEHAEARRRLYEQSVEDSQWEEEPQTTGECYLCHAMPEHDHDIVLRNAGLPQSYLHVCSRCDGSWQHQTDKREAWLAENSEV